MYEEIGFGMFVRACGEPAWPGDRGRGDWKKNRVITRTGLGRFLQDHLRDRHSGHAGIASHLIPESIPKS